jgi:uncharacterized protein (DUF488 family)
MTDELHIYTIGFTKKTASVFFETLKRAQIERLLDVRLNNSNQLAGFSKRDDLEYFLRTICGAEYRHELLLAPTQEMRDAYRGGQINFEEYAEAYRSLISHRKVETHFSVEYFMQKRTVLLCSEATAEHCHRRIAVEYLNANWKNVSAVHL